MLVNSRYVVLVLTLVSFAACNKGGGDTGSGKMVNRGSINSVIAAHQGDVQKCYEKGLMENGTLAGEVKVSFDYDKAGSVTSCNVVQNLAVEKVGECICESVKGWKFSSSFEPSNKVAYNWNLKPTTPAKVEVGIAQGDMEVITTNQKIVVKCYEAALKKDRTLEGALGVAIHLSGDGSVKQCELKQNLSDESVGTCVCDGIKEWKFATPEKPNKVIFYTWNLKPETKKGQ